MNKTKIVTRITKDQQSAMADSLDQPQFSYLRDLVAVAETVEIITEVPAEEGDA